MKEGVRNKNDFKIVKRLRFDCRGGFVPEFEVICRCVSDDQYLDVGRRKETYIVLWTHSSYINTHPLEPGSIEGCAIEQVADIVRHHPQFECCISPWIQKFESGSQTIYHGLMSSSGESRRKQVDESHSHLPFHVSSSRCSPQVPFVGASPKLLPIVSRLRSYVGNTNLITSVKRAVCEGQHYTSTFKPLTKNSKLKRVSLGLSLLSLANEPVPTAASDLSVENRGRRRRLRP